MVLVLLAVLGVLVGGIVGLYCILEVVVPMIYGVNKYKNLYPIDTSKYKITENGNVIK